MVASTYNLADLFESVVDAFGDSDALITADAHYSYGALDSAANKIAHYLNQQGLEPGEHIGIYAHNSAEWVIAMLACFKIRAVPININYRYVSHELRYIVDNADLKAIIFQNQMAEIINPLKAELSSLKAKLELPTIPSERQTIQFEHQCWQDIIEKGNPKRNFAARSSEDKYVLYTGGTTGYPKGVVWQHEAIFFGALQGGNPGGEAISKPEELTVVAQKGLRLRSLVCPPLMHGGGLWTSLISLLSAGCVILNSKHPFNADHVLSMCAQHKAGSLMIIGDAMAVPLLEQLSKKQYDLSSLFSLGSGGTLLSHASKTKLNQALPHILILDSFGASETGNMGGAISDDSNKDAQKNNQATRFSVTENVAVLDEHNNPIANGSDKIGYLAKSGYIPQGYYGDPEKTAEIMRSDSSGKAWCVLGDYARVCADGTIEVLGRASVCINSGGEKIFAEEVEMAIKNHPQISDVVVVGATHQRFGQQVIALAKHNNTQDNAEDSAPPSYESMRLFLEQYIAAYKCPKHIFWLDEVPRTPVGKPDYRKASSSAEALLAKLSA